MFSKKSNKIETLIGSNTFLSGSAEVKGTFRVDGKFEGNVKADWIVVGEKGHIKGELHASGVVVGGTVEGNIIASSSIELGAKGRILGDINTQKFSITEGGLYEGYSKMKHDKERVKEAPAVVETGEGEKKDIPQ